MDVQRLQELVYVFFPFRGPFKPLCSGGTCWLGELQATQLLQVKDQSQELGASEEAKAFYINALCVG